ncbi:hypothetical protein Hanom_Chr14g01319901 [Helianthus anomalus]
MLKPESVCDGPLLSSSLNALPCHSLWKFNSRSSTVKWVRIQKFQQCRNLPKSIFSAYKYNLLNHFIQ